MIINIGMLAIANSRSIHYIQKMVDNDYFPSFVIVLQSKKNEITTGQKTGNSNEKFLRILSDNNIEFQIVPTIDINDKKVIQSLSKREEYIFIYSGPSGAILKKEILSIGKKFLHIHPGKLPNFKGSTTVYYHILSDSCCSASAIFLEENIDTGPIIHIKDYPLPENNIDLDYEYDPIIRSVLLIEVLNKYVQKNTFELTKQNSKSGETYFIMHPVLRHIARLKLEK